MRFFSFFFFASNRFFQEPAYKEDKNRVILNKMKQIGKAEQFTYEEQRLKNSPDKNHTKHSSHLISCYMLWGSWEHQAPRQQCSWGSSLGSLYVTVSCTRTRTYQWPRQKYTCMHRWPENHGAGLGENGKRRGQSRICYQLETGDPENPSAVG